MLTNDHQYVIQYRQSCTNRSYIGDPDPQALPTLIFKFIPEVSSIFEWVCTKAKIAYNF